MPMDKGREKGIRDRVKELGIADALLTCMANIHTAIANGKPVRITISPRGLTGTVSTGNSTGSGSSSSTTVNLSKAAQATALRDALLQMFGAAEHEAEERVTEALAALDGEQTSFNRAPRRVVVKEQPDAENRA